MDGAYIYYEIQLDEERILADGRYDLEKMYAFMDEAFKENDCCLEKIVGKKRIYSRDKDAQDLSYLWMGISRFQKADWFEEYVCHFMFCIYDEENGEMDTEEDWLEECGILRRRKFRTEIKEIITDIKNMYVFDSLPFFRKSSDISDVVKRLLADTPYQLIEEDGFLLFHRKDLCEYRDGLRLISVRLDRCRTAGVAASIYLMQNDFLPDSSVVAFLRDTGEKGQEVKNLVKLLRKTQRTYRAMVLDVTNTGLEETCDFTIENGYLTKRMYSNLTSALHSGRNKWKIIPEDWQMLKSILFSEEHLSSSIPRKNDCDYFRECDVKCFSFCLPVEGNLSDGVAGEKIIVNPYRFGWYIDKLVTLADEKI